MENTCIACGVVMPEGRQICPNCEQGHTPQKEKEDTQNWR